MFKAAFKNKERKRVSSILYLKINNDNLFSIDFSFLILTTTNTIQTDEFNLTKRGEYKTVIEFFTRFFRDRQHN